MVKIFHIPQLFFLDSVRIDIDEIGKESVDWINLARDTNWFQVFVKTIMNLLVPKNGGNSLKS
jgi:hypothetical protein